MRQELDEKEYLSLCLVRHWHFILCMCLVDGRVDHEAQALVWQRWYGAGECSDEDLVTLENEIA